MVAAPFSSCIPVCAWEKGQSTCLGQAIAFFSRLGRVHMHAMDGWRTKRSAHSPPPAPVRKAKRPVGQPKKRALVLEDPDDWVVREAPTPTKLSCSPPDVEVASITTPSEPVKTPIARLPVKPVDPKPGLSLAELLMKYPPLSIRQADDPDGWL